jgi:type I restriction enzyme S subunit
MNLPALRFQEFSEKWQTFTLNEICSTFKSGLGITSEKIDGNGLYPVYGGNGLRGYTSEFTHDGFYALIGRQGALCGNINLANGKSFISEHAVAVQANESNNTKWLAYKLELMKLNRLSESSAQPGLSVTKLLKITIEIPKKQEQTKIANFLTAIDEKLSQLTQKCELLTQYKKGVMQQIFSQELRFKDDDGQDFPEWNETTLGNIATFLRGGSLSKSDISPDGKFECVHYGELFTIYSEVIRSLKSKTNLTETIKSEFGDILMPSSDVTPAGLAKASCILKAGIILGGDINIIRLKDKTEPIFISYLLNFYKHKIIELVSGTTVKHIYIKDIKTISMTVPHAIKEQTKIANFLTAIDEKITTTQTQLKAVKQYKQGLLQQMFV